MESISVHQEGPTNRNTWISWNFRLRLKMSASCKWGVTNWGLCGSSASADSPAVLGANHPPCNYWEKLCFVNFCYAPFCHAPFCGTAKMSSQDWRHFDHWVFCHREINWRFRKRVVLANVPSFRFSFRGNMRTYPRSGFRFFPGEHPNVPSFRFSFQGNIRQNHHFGNHPFRFLRFCAYFCRISFFFFMMLATTVAVAIGDSDVLSARSLAGKIYHHRIDDARLLASEGKASCRICRSSWQPLSRHGLCDAGGLDGRKRTFKDGYALVETRAF